MLASSGEAVYWRVITSKGPRNWLKGGGCDFSQHIEVGAPPHDYRVYEGTQYLLLCP